MIDFISREDAQRLQQRVDILVEHCKLHKTRWQRRVTVRSAFLETLSAKLDRVKPAAVEQLAAAVGLTCTDLLQIEDLTAEQLCRAERAAQQNDLLQPPSTNGRAIRPW